jgi:hypothetical protein
MSLRTSLPDVPAVDNPGLYELLQALRRQVVANTNAIADAEDMLGLGGGGGETGSGDRDPLSFVLDYGATNNISVSSDAQLDAYKADVDVKDIYIRAGEYSTTKTRSFFTKRHRGRGQFVNAGYTAPANLGYLSVLPAVSPIQGELGWFAGDQSFTDNEWKTLGPNVRGFQPDARYFESAVIPHHAWWDVESGSGGIVGYATGGVTPGLTITLSTGTDPSWVNQKAYIKDSFGGSVISDTHAGTTADPHVPLTIASVAGNVVTFTTAHTANMTWTPTAGKAPNLSLSNRTWGGFDYLRVRARAGGDTYGRIVRMQIEYQPKPWELGHVFNSGTGGQMGGSADFQPGTGGMMTTGWESQFNAIAQGASPAPDVAVYAQVDSFSRGNDRADGGGRVWIGTTRQSSGPRPADAAYVLRGPWRRGLDTTGGFLNEGSYLTAAASGATLQMKWSSGARVGVPISIQHATTPYFGTVSAVAGNTVSVTPALPITYPVDSIVDIDGGGAAVIMKAGQGINWDGSENTAGRGSDPLQVFGVPFGNQLGSIWSRGGSDGNGPLWETLVDTGRIRLRNASFSVNVDILGGRDIHAARDLITDASSISPQFQGALSFGSGSGNYIAFNIVTQKYQFYVNSALVASIPP